MIDQLKKMKLTDLMNLDTSKLTTEEVAYVERRLINSANRRVRNLKKRGKLSQSKLTRKERSGLSVYKPPKSYKPKGSTGAVYVSGEGKKARRVNVRNRKISNIERAKRLLEKKTSTVRAINEQAERYKNVIKDATGYEGKITNNQARKIGRLMERAKELGLISEGANKKLSGSPTTLRFIVELVKMRVDNGKGGKRYLHADEIEEALQTAITEGYEKAQEYLNELDEEDSDEVEITDDDYDIFD